LRRYSVVSERLNRKAAYDATGEVVTKWQGLTLVHFSAHHKRLLWYTLGGFIDF
jgi:hypothetical protein